VLLESLSPLSISANVQLLTLAPSALAGGRRAVFGMQFLREQFEHIFVSSVKFLFDCPLWLS
jgi:hypothetical protein